MALLVKKDYKINDISLIISCPFNNHFKSTKYMNMIIFQVIAIKTYVIL